MNQKAKKINVFIVRFLPLMLFTIIGTTILDCWNGIFRYDFSLLHSNSLFYALALFFVSLADSKYHCVWNRAMYIELMVVPLVNYIDAKVGIFPTAEGLLITLSVTWVLTLIATIFLAVRHFVRPRIKKYRKRRAGDGR